MNAEELRGKSVDELTSLLIDMKKEQLNLRFQRSTGELANTARVRTVRKTIARIKTFLATPENRLVAAGKIKVKAEKPAKKSADKKEAKAAKVKKEEAAPAKAEKKKVAKKAAAKKE